MLVSFLYSSRTPTARAPHLHASLATEELTAVSINARVLAAVRQDGSDDLMVPPTAETDLGNGMESLSVTERVLLAVRQDEDSLRSRKTRELVLQAVRQDQKPCAVLVVTTALPAPRPSTPQWLVPLKTWRQKLVEARVAARRPADRALVLRAVRQVASSAIVPTKPAVPHVMIPAARTWRQDLAEKRAAALQGRTPRGLPEASSRPMLPTYRSAPVPVVDMSWRQTYNGKPRKPSGSPPRQPTQSFARVKAAAKGEAAADEGVLRRVDLKTFKGVAVPVNPPRTTLNEEALVGAKTASVRSSAAGEDNMMKAEAEGAEGTVVMQRDDAMASPSATGAWVPVAAPHSAAVDESTDDAQTQPDLAAVEVWYGSASELKSSWKSSERAGRSRLCDRAPLRPEIHDEC